MLPSELVVARVKSGRIFPSYLAPDGENKELAESLIRAYSKGIGSKRGDLLKVARSFEEEGFDFRVVRGLCALLDRLSIFEVRSPVDPQILRAHLFSLGRPVLDNSERIRILEMAASKFGIRADEIALYMWADLQDERVLSSFSPPSPEDLIASYNLALTQTILFRSTFLDARVSGNFRPILWAVKRLGLMYSIKGEGDELTISVEGPASAIKLTERYGTSMAKLLPRIVAADRWEIRSQVVSKSFGRRRLLDFRLGSSDGVFLPRNANHDETYDSSLEESFAQQFRALQTGWALVREPGIIQTKHGAFIPDFAFERRGRRVYLEIVGFWTPEYIERKLSKLNSLENVEIIVAVDRSLGVSDKIAICPGRVIEFEGKVPLKPIIDRLDALDESILRDDLDKLGRTAIQLSGDLIDIEVLAKSLDVSPESILAKFQRSPPQGHLLLGKYLVSPAMARRLEGLISSERKLSAIEQSLGKLGISDPVQVLRGLGFSVVWRGISPETAEVVRDGR